MTFDDDGVARALRFSFRSGVEPDDDDRSGRLALAFRGHALSLPSDSAAVAEAAITLRHGHATEDELAMAALDADGADGMTALAGALRTWDQLGLLRRALRYNADAIVSAEPMVPGISGRLERPRMDSSVRLSRFACCRRDDDVVMLESPLSPVRVVLHQPVAAAALVPLAGGARVDEIAVVLAQAGAAEAEEMAAGLLGLLIFAELAHLHEAGEHAPEDDGHHALWEFHDLLFHARSRLGRHDYPVGGTFRMRDSVAALPALPPSRGAAVVELPGVDVREGRAAHARFADVVERRRSIRRHAAEPMGLHELGEFLHRSARVRHVIARDDESGIPYDATERPYPSGGSTYDLELYVFANRCAGLEPGVFHYEADRHRLAAVAPPSRVSDAIVREARSAAGMDTDPQVLLVVTSRFARVSWKYQAIAYALTLKAVGALYQTMYLTATAMGLAPCAIGTGDGALMARLLGTDFATESSVGEFLLGSAAG